MAVLVAVGGAALGSAVGIGWSAGWLIGSIIGNLLFPNTSSSTTEGPRLGDLSVTSSAYGSAIGICYGTVRTAGNMIWSTGLEEVKTVTKQKSGGKGMGGGGSSSTAITYSYYSSFAISFCEGVADDVLRLWCDGKLIYDKTGSNDDITKVDLKFRFYSGSETQNPDSLILADKGVANTPAFRGLCYIVFDRLPLEDFGNRIPNITAELTFNGANERPYLLADFFTTGEGGIADAFQTDEVFPDFNRGYFYAVDASPVRLRRFNLRTMKEDRQSLIEQDNYGNTVEFATLHGVLPNGYLVLTTGTSNSRPVQLVDPNTLQISNTFGYNSRELSMSPTHTEAMLPHLAAGLHSNTGRVYLLCGSGFNSVGVFEATNGQLKYVWDSDTFGDITESRIPGLCAGAVGDGFCEGYYLLGPRYIGATADPLRLKKMLVQDGAGYDYSSGQQWGTTDSTIGNYTPNDFIPGQTTLLNVKGLIYDEVDDTVMLQAQAGISPFDVYMIKINCGSGEIVWRTKIPFMVNVQSGWNQSRVSNGVYGQMSFEDAFALYTASGEIFHTASDWPVLFETGAGWWDGNTNTITGVKLSDPRLCKWYFFRGNGGGLGLDEIVQDVCGRVGLMPEDIDVSALASVTVPGYLVSRQSTGRALLEQLAGIYLFDGVETDYILKFAFRDGKSVSAVIPQQDLAPLDESGEFFKETRTQEVELPLRITLTYLDKENDYQQQAHSAKRILNPVPTMSSRNELSKEVPLVLEAVTAKQAAEKILFASWVERASYALMLPWTYLYLDPADVVQIELDSGTTFRTRLIQTDVGTGYSIDVSALSEDEAQYSSNTEAFGGDGPLAQEFLSDPITKLILLATPLLRDSDDSSRTVSRLYYFMGGYGQSGWKSALLFKSAEGTEYTEVGASIAEVTWGSASTKLADTDAPFATDYTNTVTIFLNTNIDIGLASATELEVLNGANAAALINSNNEVEVFQFQTATPNADGSYTLSGLIRGRRGTEWATGLHSVGDVFVLLEDETGSKLSLALGELNADRYYKAVTSGRLFEEVGTEVLASPGNDLKPYAPVHLAKTSGTWGGDIILEWQRRTRISGALQDLISDVPLAEDFEAYTVEILFGSVVVRAIENLTSPTLTYSAANQGTDFPGGFIDVTSELMVNPGFETGSIFGWSYSANTANAIMQGADGNIDAPQEGNFWLSMAEVFEASGEIQASQIVDLSSWSSQILTGTLQARVKGWIAGSVDDIDEAELVLIWLAADGTELGEMHSAHTQPPADGSWAQLSVTATAPIDAKSLKIILEGSRTAGTEINIGWDSITLEIDEGTKSSLNFRAYQLSAQVGRGFASKIKTVEV